MKTIEIKVVIDATDVSQVEAACTFLTAIGGQDNAPIETIETPKQEKIPKKGNGTKKEDTIKVEDIRALLATKVDNYRADIKAKLTELGAANVTTLDKSEYVGFVAFLNGLE